MSATETKPALPSWAFTERCDRCGLPTYWNNASTTWKGGNRVHTHSGGCPTSVDAVLDHMGAEESLLRVGLIRAGEAVSRLLYDTTDEAFDAMHPDLKAALFALEGDIDAAIRGAHAYKRVEGS